jgi:preprotein translocase subunit YajC
MNQLALFLPLLVMLALIMYFGSRRQKRAMQSTIDLQESLRIGDLVHTTSGLQGTITDIGEDDVDLEIAPGVVTTWMKLAIRDRIAPETIDADAGQPAPTAEADVANGHETDLPAAPERLPVGDPKRLPKD